MVISVPKIFVNGWFYFNPLTGTLKLQSNGPLDSSWYTSPPSPFLAVPNATAHPSTTSVFILFDVSLFLL